MQQMLVYMYNLDARPVQMGIEKSTVALCTSINVKQRRTHLLKTVTVAKETSRDFQNAWMKFQNFSDENRLAGNDETNIGVSHEGKIRLIGLVDRVTKLNLSRSSTDASPYA